jgi:hypothetical protein
MQASKYCLRRRRGVTVPGFRERVTREGLATGASFRSTWTSRRDGSREG